MSLQGEPDELLDLAVRHAVDRDGNVDGPDLRDALRAAMTPAWEPPRVGSASALNASNSSSATG
jgi:hypothetical protein